MLVKCHDEGCLRHAENTVFTLTSQRKSDQSISSELNAVTKYEQGKWASRELCHNIKVELSSYLSVHWVPS